MRKYNRNNFVISTRKAVDTALMGHIDIPSEEDYILSVIQDVDNEINLELHFDWELGDLMGAMETILIRMVFERFGVKIIGRDSYNNPKSFLRWYNQMLNKARAYEAYQDGVMGDSLELMRAI